MIGPVSPSRSALLGACCCILVGLAMLLPGTALAVTGAAFTTVNEGVDGTGHCKNGNPAVNCNIYDGKEFVWLNGGPSVAYVGDGTYFFAVLEPGGQADPNDGTAKNLSDDFDTYNNRTFSVTGGTVGYLGTHDFDSNKVRLDPYDDTTNPGGVYILAICSLGDGYPVTPSDCKYDAFKVQEGDVTGAVPLTIAKDASGSNERKYAWTIGKDVDKTLVRQLGGSATFSYTVNVSHDAGTVGAVNVSGTISIYNFNLDLLNNIVPVSIDGVSDELSDGTDCTVTGGGAQSLTEFQTDFPYSCDLAALPQGVLDNTATVTWSEQLLDNGQLLDGDSADFTFKSISFSEEEVDECVNVTDSYAGSLGSACVGDANPKSFYYQRTIPIPQFNCLSYDNTATFTTNDTAATGSAGKTVTVCGPVRTGALTMGFWQNKNGQGIVKSGASTAGVCDSGTWLRQYAPFQDLSASATCSGVATYVYNVIKAATCTSTSKTCNSMLKAQMLATALDVYFSDPALGGNRIGAPAPIGGVSIDLTKICTMIDGGGGGTCSGSFVNVSSAFGGATSMTVLQMLTYAASQSNSGGSTWYANVKATQVKAKDAFDAINNQVAFSP
jgi:hypothetical protein